jgi:DNA repair protein RecO (recombination protein O)
MAKAAITNIEGYVIHLSSYRENDAMVNVLTKDGISSFSARGILKPNSKNGGACQLLSLSRFSLSGKDGGTLAEAIGVTPVNGKDDLGTLASFSFLAEITAKTVQSEEAVEIYPWLDGTLKAIAKGFDPLTASLVYFAHVLVIEGYGLNVDACVYCGEKNGIAGLSYSDGGFVCKNDLADDSLKISPRKLKIMRYIFRCGLSDISRVSFEKEETKDLFRELGRYLNDLTGVTLRSLAILEKS